MINLEKKIKYSLINNTYISPLDVHCNQKFNCKIFTDNNKLISYDGSHLTKSGAKFFGKKLFENKNLMMYKNY